MNYLWGGMILVGVVYAAMTGNLGAVTDQALASAKEAVSLCLTMTGAMAFWVGLMKIAEKGGMVNRAASAMGPILRFLFPSVPENSTEKTEILPRSEQRRAGWRKESVDTLRFLLRSRLRIQKPRRRQP